MVAPEPVPDSQTRFKKFRSECGDFEPYRNEIREYFYPISDVVSWHLGCTSVAEFMQAVELYTGDDVFPSKDALKNNRWTAAVCEAIVFFVMERFRSFYDIRPADPKRSTAKKELNRFKGKSLYDLCPKNHNFPNPSDTQASTVPTDPSGTVLSAEQTTVDPILVSTFFSHPEHHKWVWAVRSRGEKTVDDNAFGFSLVDHKQRPPVGGIVAIHLEAFVRLSFVFGKPAFSFVRALFVTKIKRDEYTAVEFNRTYEETYKIDEKVSAELIGGLNRFVEFTANSGFLNGNYSLDDGAVFTIQPNMIRFEFEAELRAHSEDIRLSPLDSTNSLSGNKQTIIESIIAAGLGGDLQSGWLTLAKQTIVILPVELYAN